MILLNVEAIELSHLIGTMFLLLFMGFGAYCYWSIMRDDSEDYSPPPRQTYPRQSSKPPRSKKQSFKDMKRIAVKKNGQYTFYRVNKYGEIFEEPKEKP